MQLRKCKSRLWTEFMQFFNLCMKIASKSYVFQRSQVHTNFSKKDRWTLLIWINELLLCIRGICRHLLFATPSALVLNAHWIWMTNQWRCTLWDCEEAGRHPLISLSTQGCEGKTPPDAADVRENTPEAKKKSETA